MTERLQQHELSGGDPWLYLRSSRSRVTLSAVSQNISRRYCEQKNKWCLTSTNLCRSLFQTAARQVCKFDIGKSPSAIFKRCACAVFALIFVFTGLDSISAENPPPRRTLLVFSAMGDVPYLPHEFVVLPQQIAELPVDSEFVVHLGDIKTGKAPCVEVTYEAVAGILAKSQFPMFIIPGDNEWNDCENPNEGWSLWLKHFSRFDERWKHGLSVRRQNIRDENFAFVRSEVLFVGINLVGGRVHDPAEWKRRHAENVLWTRENIEQHGDSVRSAVIFGHALPTKDHQDFFDGLCDVATKFNKPILYLQGDGHRWIQDYPFPAKNILRIQVDQGSIAPPIKVSVTDDLTNPFVIDRRKEK